ncbi:MAG: glycoside hydrolase family 11 protein, partial [Ruminococcus sp.]|nr:glycoside hydrolase family 11 protein [Ruminococcus sp.]
MKLSRMKKILSGTVSALMIATSIPTVSFAADQQTRGNIGGYDYEMWNQNGQGQVSMNPGAGSFTCSWSNIENFLARMGKNFDSQKKNYKQIGEIVLTYDVEYTPRGNSYMCVYGWTRNPLMEYYIVEGWGDWRPPGNDGERKGTVTLNGNTYDIAKTMRYNQPSLDGNATFPQYWSIRQTSGSANNQTNYMKGTIDVSKHFDAWSKAGLDMSGTLYEVSLNIEGYRSNGSANVKSVTVSTDGSGAGAVQQGGGQQQGGFDMGGGQQQGGFDMGGFDWSQFGGQQGGQQQAGGQQGGFDMGNFDWSQFGGQQAGGQPAGGQQTGGNTGNSTSDINSKVTKWGDANGDGSVDMGDVVAVMQALAAPNKYKLTEQGQLNADVFEAGSGLTANDALSIQKYLLGTISKLPESYAQGAASTNTNTNTQPANGGQQAGGQQQGGFDMGNFDWSQFGGQQGGQQAGGQQQGGFNMGNFDWSQFGGQQGGFDWNQGGGQQGGGAVAGGQTFSVGNGRNQYKADNVDGYSYEIWLDNTGGSGSMTLGSGGAFSTEWSAQVSQGNFLARRGRNYDRTKKATDCGPIVMDYAADYSASSQGNSRLCVYGWMTDPLVEYYIIEDWVNWRPTANG